MARIGYRLGPLALVASAAAVVATAGSTWLGSPAPSRAAAVARTSAENEAAAQSDASALLATLSLPQGAVQSSTEPAGDDSLLAGPGEHPATPKLVDDHAWWVVPGTPKEAFAYVRTHLPSSARRSGQGQSGGPGEPEVLFESFEWPSIAGVLSQRSLHVAVVQLADGSTGLRADAQVVWVTPRPPSEVIPPGAHLLRISVHSRIAANQPKQRRLTLTSSKRIDKIVALINALRAAQPGLRNCPADFGIDVRLAFYARRGVLALAVAKVDAEGCSGVALAIGGKAQPELEGWGLIEGLDHVLGCELDVVPPSRHVRGCPGSTRGR